VDELHYRLLDLVQRLSNELCIDMDIPLPGDIVKKLEEREVLVLTMQEAPEEFKERLRALYAAKKQQVTDGTAGGHIPEDIPGPTSDPLSTEVDEVVEEVRRRDLHEDSVRSEYRRTIER
jgi:hypothetical protein